MSDRMDERLGHDGPGGGRWVPHGAGHAPHTGQAPHVVQGETWDPPGPQARPPGSHTALLARGPDAGRSGGAARHRGSRAPVGPRGIPGLTGRSGGPGGPAAPVGTGPPRRAPRPPRSRARRLLRALVLLLCLLLVTSAGVYVWADTRLRDDVDLAGIADRPPPGRGTNYLIVGSDSRAGMSERDRKVLHTGGSPDDGRRTDSVMLLHTGAHGATMMSLPRDSWVTIPPYVRPDTGTHHRAAKDKLNAAFSYGGPRLLARTVERNTGLRVDHYAEMDFTGFVGIVNAVGGVRMCVDRDVRDKKSGLDLTRGCHVLDGRSALAFVRQRHQEKQGDIGRGRNQQEFLAALARKIATPGVALDPARSYATARAGLGSLIVDEDTDMRTLASLFGAMRGVTAGEGRRISVPVASLGVRTPRGSAITWDGPRAEKLFAELRGDRPVDPGNTAGTKPREDSPRPP